MNEDEFADLHLTLNVKKSCCSLVVWIWGLNCKWTIVQVLCTWWPRTLSLTQCPGYWTTVQLLLLYNLKF